MLMYCKETFTIWVDDKFGIQFNKGDCINIISSTILDFISKGDSASVFEVNNLDYNRLVREPDTWKMPQRYIDRYFER